MSSKDDVLRSRVEAPQGNVAGAGGRTGLAARLREECQSCKAAKGRDVTCHIKIATRDMHC
jgi:hypothetical protein